MKISSSLNSPPIDGNGFTEPGSPSKRTPHLHQPTDSALAKQTRSKNASLAPRSSLRSLGHLQPPAANADSPSLQSLFRQETQESESSGSKQLGAKTIVGLIDSMNPDDVAMKQKVFSDKFQSKQDFAHFFSQELGGSVAAKLREPASNWSTRTFHALFVASWMNHPTEKGTYMIDLSGLPKEELNEVTKAFNQHLYSRESSHLDGGGRSASEGFEFLKNYRELLVQMPVIDDKPYLFLKTESRTTQAKDVIPHMRSWLHKVRTGEGRVASPDLHALASAAPDIVEARAAENHSKAYGKLLKWLGLHGKKTTTHEMATALLQRTDFVQQGVPQAGDIVQKMSNNTLGKVLLAYCDTEVIATAEGKQTLSKGMIAELRKLGVSLLADPPGQRGRVFREVYARPDQLDETIRSLSAGVQRHDSSVRRLGRQSAFKKVA